MKREFSRQIFEKYSNIKFHKNPSSGTSFFFPHADGQAVMTKLKAVLSNFANGSKKSPNGNYRRACTSNF